MIVDTHCHIDRFPNPLALAAQCEKASVLTVAVTNLPSHYSMAVKHLGSLQFVKPALGFHPLAVADNLHELSTFKSLLQSVDFVGEIGLDYSSQGIHSREAQVEAFRSIAGWLAESPKFVTLHSRKSANEVLSILVEAGVSDAVFHWYSDSAVVLRKAIDAGFHFSINEAMLSSQTGRRVLDTVPRERVLTETDGPYVKSARKPSTPLDVRRIIDGIAEEWGAPTQVVEDQVEQNFRALCKKLSIRLPECKDAS